MKERTLPVNGEFQLIALPYAEDALMPVITPQTLSFHHGKHLKAYVDNLNAALPGSHYAGMSLEAIVQSSDGSIYNNAGQVLNHNLYFTQFRAPREGTLPVGRLSGAMAYDFGSFEAFCSEFEAGGRSIFGSGWVFLAADDDGKLQITQAANAGNPIRRGLHPILTFDVWEHAYYLDWQNRRADYLHALWQIVNWDEADRRYGEL